MHYTIQGIDRFFDAMVEFARQRLELLNRDGGI